jgi:hypothetical protein
MKGSKLNAIRPNRAPQAPLLDFEKQADLLFQKLEQERGKDSLSLSKAVKGYSTRADIFAADPAVQVAFVRQVVATIAKLGKSTGKIPELTAWFHDLSVPYGAEEVARQLLRRRLPFTDAMLAEMIEQIGGMDFITFAPVLEPLVRELEKRKAEGVLPAPIRKGLPRILKALLVKGWPAEAREEWGLPRPPDRKLAERIQMLLK